LEIPRGKTCTYSQLASRLGKPNAARAVGNAVGKNRIAYLIPCHRVIREDQSQGGYRWGTTRKSEILANER
jgi:AraC family transcriptional regulator of adaptative response/methylated-DNA-[protein]-cysteine methyltransferase